MDEPKRYAYKPSAIAALFGIAMFAGGAVLMYSEAQSGDSLLLYQLIALPPAQAGPVFWLLTAACVIMCAYFLLGLYRIVTRRGEILLDATTLTVPPSPFASGLRVLPLADILALSLVQAGRRRLLRLRLPQSHLDLNLGFFENPQTYQAFERDLGQAMAAADSNRGVPPSPVRLPPDGGSRGGARIRDIRRM